VVEFTAAARRQLRRIDPPVRRRVLAAVAELAVDPRPPGARALTGSQWGDALRIRVGDWRVLYLIEDGRLLVTVVTVGHRGAVYR
jgi:mRNA interferase RelE/StbE